MSRLLLALTLLAAAPVPGPAPLRVKASQAVAPCVAASALEYERATGQKLAVETAPLFDAASTEGADVVVAADAELNRIIEGGATHPDLDGAGRSLTTMWQALAGMAAGDMACAWSYLTAACCLPAW